MQFSNRHQAGRQLSKKLLGYVDHQNILVLGLPRGGIPVAAPIADRLRAPLDVIVVRKLGVPGQPELAMGAVALDRIRVLNYEVISALQISNAEIEAVAAREEQELVRRDREYRGERPFPEVHAKTVILVDDGIATGSTMSAAITAMRQKGAGWVVVAAPAIARDSYNQLTALADEVVCVIAPEEFFGVAQCYEDFTQTTDAEVQQLLAHRTSPASS